jgi:hypothetical protein
MKKQEIIQLIRDVIEHDTDKINLAKWKNYFICKGRRGGEPNCGKVFFNNDDNVCVHCGSKNTVKVNITYVKANIL